MDVIGLGIIIPVMPKLISELINGSLSDASRYGGWMMFAFLIPYCLGGIAGPALQSIMSSQVPANEQGELQGALTSLISVTTIISPPLMTNLFSYFTGSRAPFYFPGAGWMMGAVLTAMSIVFAMRSLSGYVHKTEMKKEDSVLEKK